MSQLPNSARGDVDSVYTQIKAEVARTPAGPIDHANVTLIESEEGYVPGLADIASEWTDDGSEWPIVMHLVAQIADGEVGDWRVLEGRLRVVDLYTNRSRVVQELSRRRRIPKVSRLFWELARSSNEPHAIKWGLTVGTVGMTRSELADLLVFARHSEFTSLACDAIVRESEHRSAYQSALVDLLALTSGLGRVVVIGAVLAVDDLIDDRAIAWRVVEAAAGLRAALMPAFGAHIVERADLVSFAREDDLTEERYAALATIAESLLGIDDPVDVWGSAEIVAFIERLVELAEKTHRSPAALALLRSLRIAHNGDEHGRFVTDLLRARIEAAYRANIDGDILRRAMHDEIYRDVGIVVAIEESIEEVMPEIIAEFERAPSALSVIALGTLGGESELTMLYHWVTEGLDRVSRSDLLAGRSVADTDDEYPASAYAVVLQFLGRLRTPEAVELIREASGDFDPVVRRAAMIAIAELEEWQLDDDLKQRAGAAVSDPFEFVRAAARAAVEHHGLDGYRSEEQTPGLN